MKAKLKIMGLVLVMCGLLSCDDDGPSGTPLANAGDDQKVLVTDTVTLDGQASTAVSNATWTFVSKPSGSNASLSNASSLTPTFNADVAGTYSLKLSINDGDLSDTVDVEAKYVLAMISNASDSQITTQTRFNSDEYVVNLEQSGAKLSASSSRGSVTSYTWEQITGPDATASGASDEVEYTFTAPGLVDFHSNTDRYKWQVLPVSLTDNNMVFRLTVADGEGHDDSTTVTVNLNDDDQEISRSSGLPNVSVGGPVYLSGPSLRWGTSATAVSDWTWTITSKPSGSSAVFADTTSSTSNLQFPKFTPDKEGVYTITYSSTVADVTGVEPGQIRVNAGSFVGVGTVAGASPRNPQCGTCHNGGAQPDTLSSWNETKHASSFEDSYSSFYGSAFNTSTLQFKTVGYSPLHADDGFDDLLSSAGLSSSSSVPATFADFASDYSHLAGLSGVQCESCHGPGSAHSGDPVKIAYSYSQTGTCGQCHRQESQWEGSAHNSDTANYHTTWLEETGCVRCHSSKGFVDYVKGGHGALQAVEDTGRFIGVTCQACHDPHNATNPDQLRLYGEVTLQDSSTVFAGKAAVCYTCHDGLYSKDEADCDVNRDGVVDSNDDGDGVVDGVCETFEQSADYYVRQVHRNPQAAVLEGVGAMTDLDKDSTEDIELNEESFHASSGFVLSSVTGDASLPSVNNKCVTCHMASGPSISEAGYNHLGEHSFAVKHGDVENLNACNNCHLNLTSFNRTARDDYDGDSEVEGIQDEVKGLLLLVSNQIKALDVTNVNQTSGTKEASGVITPGTVSFKSSPTNLYFNATSDLVRRSVWNHNMVVRGADLGIHNTAFVVKVLQGTYKKIAGVDVPGASIR